MRVLRRGVVLPLALAGGLLLGPGVARAQEEDELALLFSRTEVTTASKIAEPAALAPADVTVITEEEIRRSGARDLADVLRTVPGIELLRDQFGAVQIVSRGLLSPSESNYILLLLDGVPANIPYYGGASLVYDDLALVGVKRIEVIRGPGSALYGASAFAGVIQVITKQGDDASFATVSGRKSRARVAGEVTAGGGSFNAGHASLSTGVKFGEDGAVALRADVLHSAGPRLRVDADAFTGVTGPDGPVSDAPGDLATSKDKIHVGLNVKLGDVSVTGSFLYNRRGDWVGNYVLVSPINYYIETDGYARVAWGKSFATDRLHVDASITAQQHNEFENQQVFPRARFDQDGDGDIDDYRAKRATDIGNLGSNGFSGAVQASWKFAPRHVLLAGFESQTVNQTDTYFYENWDSNGISAVRVPLPFNTAVSRQIVGGFVNDDWTLVAGVTGLHRLRVLAGVRFDDYKDNVFLKQTFGDGPHFSALAPRAGLVWEVAPGYYAKYLYGRAFRPASFRELYSNDPNVVVGVTNLKPETVDFHEVSVGVVRPRVQFQATGFLGRATNLIVSRNSGTTILFGNLGITETNGVEADLRVNPVEKIQLFGNATVQSVRNADVGVEAASVSKIKGTAGASAEIFPWLVGYGSASYLGPRRQPDYATEAANDRTVDGYLWATLSLTFRVPQNALELQLTGQNLADAKIRDPFDGPALPGELPGEGRSLWAEARWRW